MLHVFGCILICIGLFFSSVGILGFYRLNNFFARILIASNIDSASIIFIMLGLAIQAPTIFFGLKIMIICVLALITGPISTHSLALSAYISGYRIK